ncbi:MAG: GNAT family N-acetyltransferase [Reyranellaceae bacterium]
MTQHRIIIAAPQGAADIAAVKSLFREYAESLGFSLCFQGFDEEMASFPAKYSPPKGGLLLASVEGQPAGAVGVWQQAPGICEMKRLYVRPQFRGLDLGRRLADAVVREGRRLGYRAMRLDTLKTMVAARSLYASMGFVEVEPYYHNPMADAVYMELPLPPLPAARQNV